MTEPIEREIQAMSDVFQIKSESYFGMSKISIELQPTLSPDYMPVKWDELRRKVANIQPRLPSGASAINVSDDFGDVFGIYYGLTADDGYTYEEMRNWGGTDQDAGSDGRRGDESRPVRDADGGGQYFYFHQ